MSIRLDSSQLVASGILLSEYPGLGILAENVPSTGTDGPALAYQNLSFPANNGQEVYIKLLSLPSAGTLVCFEDTSFEFTGAPDGTYQFDFETYLDGIVQGTTTTTFNIGVAATNLVLNEINVNTTIDSISVNKEITINLNELIVSSTIDTIAVNKEITLALNELNTSTVIDSIQVNKEITLALNELIASTTIDSISLNGDVNLVLNEINVTTTIDPIVINKEITLTLNEISVNTTVDQIPVNKEITINLNELNTSTVIDQISVGKTVLIVINKINVTTTIDSVVVSSISTPIQLSGTILVTVQKSKIIVRRT